MASKKTATGRLSALRHAAKGWRRGDLSQIEVVVVHRDSRRAFDTAAAAAKRRRKAQRAARRAQR